MHKRKFSEVFRFRFRKELQYLFQGLAVLAPIGITVWVVLFLFNFVDGILPATIHAIVPNWQEIDASGHLKSYPGLGFILVIVFVLLVGRISSLLLFEKIEHGLDFILEKTPGVSFIYSTVKDFFESFAGNKKKFDQPVLVNVDGPDVWRVGFITMADAQQFELQDHIGVYVPHSYAVSGITYIVPKNKVKYLKDFTAGEAMKFAVSGGIVQSEVK